jgi:hypothetical protein
MVQKLIDAKSEFLEARLNEASQLTHGFHGSKMMADSIPKFVALKPLSFSYDVLKLILDAKYDPHDSWCDYRYIDGINSTNTIFSLFFSLQQSPTVKVNEDFSMLQLCIDYKLDVNHYYQTALFKLTYVAACATLRQPSLIMFILDSKGDVHGVNATNKPTGALLKAVIAYKFFGIDPKVDKIEPCEWNFFGTARDQANEMAVTTYNDWLRLRKAEE